ncbi:hypothetical protein WR25_07657 [Diploscapter pachys]|uniref:Glycosyl-hydrolase family 116 catalytic region domain-containing protein n=1 Tax=Diploscapter pachys TaxID=2018661 RepID=A0A2A2LUY0_9BILA|nr:hypothetical protein WR25_07657 [Diploscapter pachys]
MTSKIEQKTEGIGWKARGDYRVPQPLANFFPRIKHAIFLIPTVIRICLYTFREWLHGREAFIDIFHPMTSFKHAGVPIGGIGSGSIGTDLRGGFGRFSLIPGVKEQNQKNVKADQNHQNAVTVEDFDPTKNGSSLFHQLGEHGDVGRNQLLKSKVELAIAVCSSMTVASNNEQTTEFLLFWHMPIINFPVNSFKYKRRYTRLAGVGNDACVKLVKLAFGRKSEWKRKIEDWQNPIVENDSLPEWYRSAIFNELYYMTDGCSIWVEYDDKWRDVEKSISDETMQIFKEYGRFTYLESWEYFMCTTFDVHFYASWAVTNNWPMIELGIQLDFCDQIEREDLNVEKSMCEGKKMKIKSYARIPHDLGHPKIEPWTHINAYLLHDTADWKDLNMKFIISCLRVNKLILNSSGNLSEKQKHSILSRFYEGATLLMDKSMQAWDRDNDGIIENDGMADQTYDIWTMDGTSAYCGSLFLASLYSLLSLADELGKTEDAQKYRDQLNNAQGTFVKKLWNGKSDFLTFIF